MIDSVKITCPHCGKRGTFDAQLRGHGVECLHCKRPFFIAGHVQVPCPKCSYTLRIRQCLLGEMVSCRHCTHQFYVQLTPGLDAVVPASQATPPPTEGLVEYGVYDPTKSILEEEVRRLRERLERLVGESAASARELHEARESLAQAEGQLRDLQGRGAELEAVQRERDAALAQVNGLIDEVDRLAAREAELDAALRGSERRQQAEIERLTRELERARQGRAAPPTEEDREEEFEVVRSLAGPAREPEGRRTAPPPRSTPRPRPGTREGHVGLEAGPGSADEVPADVASRLAELQDRLRATANRLTQPKA